MEARSAHAKSLKGAETYFPMKHEGTIRIVYTLVDTIGNPYPLTQAETDELMQNTERYYEDMFRGTVDIELVRAGRVYIDIDNTEVCEWSDPFDWAELVDAQVDGSLDLDGNAIDLFNFDD